MTLRVPLFLTIFLLLCFGTNALAQQPPRAAPPPAAATTAPPAPSAAPSAPSVAPPPTPTLAALAPQAPAEPETFSFFFNGQSYLGIYAEDINTENMRKYGLSEPRGVAVSRVIDGSPAASAGLRKDDVILRFNGEEVTSAQKLNRLISEVAPEHKVRLAISRGGVEQEISVTLAKRENFPRSFRMTLPRQELDRLRGDLGELGNTPGRDEFSFVFGANRRIGVSASPLTKQLADYFGVPEGRGVLITSVNENGPAAKAGLKAGDVITAVDGVRIERLADLMRELNRRGEGEVTLQVIRDKSSRTFKLTPERGQAFDFGPEINIAPQVGRVVLPQITLPVIPALRIRATPQIVLPALPKIDKIVIPSIPAIKIPRIQTTPL
ncbi:MAG TPA: PDZ domain-containing protein [Pyrinomonadaceae bacterium]